MTTLQDLLATDAVSDCCSAKVYNPGDDECGICMDCKEHCGMVEPEEDEMTLGSMDRF